MTDDIQTLVTDVKRGKGSLGEILTDTTLAYNLNDALQKLRQVGTQAEELVTTIDVAVKDLKQDIDSGDGPLNALLKDSSMVNKINSSLENLEKGTESFNENMEALKHNFLFRRYFRRMEKRNKSSQ
jgi:phospholipid/cholesterol/gamma-HCH transport system substrate-binding protein